MLKQLGKYEIKRVLGQGAMGEVYLAHHPTIGRDVAIKTILPTTSKRDDAEDRFRREATAAGKLNHPNVVTIFDFDKEGDLLYLVMEYVKGEDLEEIITKKSMSPGQFLEVLAQVCDGLSYAHMNGILHRDIKPSNIRVVQDGKRILAKVMDFGIARTEDSNMTATGMVMGTVSYMAPEYIQTGHSSIQGDLWAVGVMLYECLSGRKPFGGDNITTILFKIVSDAPAPIEPGSIQGISPAIKDILDRALSKDPAQRIQSADELARRLRSCKDPTWTGATDATGMFTAPAIPADEAVILPPAMSPTPSAAALPAMAPPDSNLPTAMVPVHPPLQPRQVEQSRKSSPRLGLLVATGLGLLVVIGTGAYVVFGRKPQPPASATAPALDVPSTAPATQSATAFPPTNAPQTSPPPAMSDPATHGSNKAITPNPGPQAATPPVVKPLPAARIEESTADKLAKAVAVLPSDPDLAAELLASLAAAQPGDAPTQGNLLAALYRVRNARDFERALDTARSNGLSGPQLMKAAPAFRQAMTDELRAHKAKDKSNVLPLATLTKIVN